MTFLNITIYCQARQQSRIAKRRKTNSPFELSMYTFLGSAPGSPKQFIKSREPFVFR